MALGGDRWPCLVKGSAPERVRAIDLHDLRDRSTQPTELRPGPNSELIRALSCQLGDEGTPDARSPLITPSFVAGQGGVSCAGQVHLRWLSRAVYRPPAGA